jgi:uncharacterized membrane protein
LLDEFTRYKDLGGDRMDEKYEAFRYMKHYNKTLDMVISSFLITLVFVATRFINIRLPISVNGGLIHLGTGMLIISAIVFGGKKGAVAGAFGMALFDVLSGWLAWAPFTFIIRGVMGYIIGRFCENKKSYKEVTVWGVIGILLSGIWMVAGYYLTEVILYGNWISPVTSVPGNIIQIVVGSVIGIPVALVLKKRNIG